MTVIAHLAECNEELTKTPHTSCTGRKMVGNNEHICSCVCHGGEHVDDRPLAGVQPWTTRPGLAKPAKPAKQVKATQAEPVQPAPVEATPVPPVELAEHTPAPVADTTPVDIASTASLGQQALAMQRAGMHVKDIVAKLKLKSTSQFYNLVRRAAAEE